MTLRVGGVEAPKIKVAGVDAKRVMVGTGQTAVEAWPGVENVQYNFNFSIQDELKWAPITGFDGRTSSDAEMAPGFVYNDMYVAGNNTDPAYHIRLVDRQVDVDTIEFDIVLGDSITTKERPSILVLASNITFTRMLIVEFGSNGVALRTVINGVAGTPSVRDMALAKGDTLGITWQRQFGNRFFTYRNNSATGSLSLSESTDFINSNGRMYPGFGVYSNHSQWSTRFQSLQIKGKSSYKPVLAASEFLARRTIPRGEWTNVAESRIHTGGTTNIYLVGASWAQASSNENRFFRILVNGIQIGVTPDEGGNLSLSNINLPENSVVTVWAFAETSTSSYRKVSGGILQIGAPNLAV